MALTHPYPFTEVRRGGERYVWDLAWYLSRRGHRVDVITGTEGSPATTVEGNATFRSFRHRRPALLRRYGGDEEDGFALTVFRGLVRRPYDVVHAFTPQAALAARLSGHRVIFSCLGAPTVPWLRSRPARSYDVFRAASRAADVVAALSHDAADRIEGIVRRPPIVLSPGVRLDVFAAKTAPPLGPPRVLFASDASARNKGIDVALTATGIVAARHPDVRLVLGGPGDHRWALAGLDAGALAAASAGRVDVLGVGPPDELPERYRQATVTVLPAVAEAFGLVLVESLASGTPVVCADEGGPPEIVDSDRVGRVFRAGDAADLARALEEALVVAADPATPRRCADHATKWGWAESAGPAHEEVYRKLAGAG